MHLTIEARPKTVAMLVEVAPTAERAQSVSDLLYDKVKRDGWDV
jgi:hypothetical protein